MTRYDAEKKCQPELPQRVGTEGGVARRGMTLEFDDLADVIATPPPSRLHTALLPTSVACTPKFCFIGYRKYIM
ncbi:unnamed protein product [Arctia plantaginis]|uniref:Uncharacterized protein n=1 Tax=Arctia plantaginis TaxID=874455 RepID=A0A8S1B7A6_ARCPL|nr:unnamed protein product [Arctia plantaginis]CAB3253988.1 unnamed protein product [Arctia plantaginis]